MMLLSLVVALLDCLQRSILQDQEGQSVLSTPAYRAIDLQQSPMVFWGKTVKIRKPCWQQPAPKSPLTQQ